MASKPTTDVKITHKDSNQGESKNLDTAVHEAAQGAEHDASTGDTLTVKESSISVDLPTGARSHPPE